VGGGDVHYKSSKFLTLLHSFIVIEIRSSDLFLIFAN
jgi:hypothetical protein